MERNMATACTITKREESTRASGLRTESKVTALWSMLTRTSTKVTGYEDNDQAKEHTNTQMATLTLASGKATPRTVMACYKWQQAIDTRVTGSMERRTDKVIFYSNIKVNIVSQTVIFTREISRMVIAKVKGYTLGLIIVTIRESGLMIR
jgi:hypothetical protein